MLYSCEIIFFSTDPFVSFTYQRKKGDTKKIASKMFFIVESKKKAEQNKIVKKKRKYSQLEIVFNFEN